MGFIPYIVIFVVFGLFYYWFESLFNAINKRVWISFRLTVNSKALYGTCSHWMVLVGGLLGVIVDILYQVPIFRLCVPMLAMAIVGGILITIVELVFGLILNKGLKLNIWDYSDFKFNFRGQIELYHFLGWIALSPIVFWIDSVIRYFTSGIGILLSPFNFYFKIITDFWTMWN